MREKRDRRMTAMRRALCLFGCCTVALAGCSGESPTACADPPILERMHRETLFPDSETAKAAVSISAPQRVDADGGLMHCRAQFAISGSFMELLPVLQTGYPFALPEAQRVFERAAGLDDAGLVAGADFLARRVTSSAAPEGPITLAAPIAYEVIDEENPFLLDWRFASTDIAARAGQLFRQRLAAAHKRLADEQLALARSRGFESIKAMRRAEVARRKVLAELEAASERRDLAANRLQLLLDEQGRIGRRLDAARAELKRMDAREQSLDGDEWAERIREQSFAQDNDLLEFSNTRLAARTSMYNTPEDVVITEVVNFSSHALWAADFHVVVWHAGRQRYFEDESLAVSFGRENLAPGEQRTLQISLNGQPGIGLAFIGEAFRSSGERHAFLFVNGLKNSRGKVIYRAQWDNPLAARQQNKAGRAQAEDRLEELRAEAAALAGRIEAGRRALSAAETRVESAQAAVPANPTGSRSESPAAPPAID